MNRPIALAAYEELAEAYASKIDTKPHNAYYERPATLSLLPDVQGLSVLDAGCGPGVYSEWLLDRGAAVVALDASPKMVDLARGRTGGRIPVHVADIAGPLPFLEDSSFDLVVSPLVLEYVEDWRATLAEFFRVTRPGGHLVVSVTHPFTDFTYFQSESYFQTELVSSEWSGFTPTKVKVPSFRRSLQETLNPVFEAGYQVQMIVEPLPTADFQKADQRHFEELTRLPAFLCIRAVKPGGN